MDNASVGRSQLGSRSRNKAAKHETEKRDDGPEAQEIREDKTKEEARRETVTRGEEDEISEKREKKRVIKAVQRL